MHIYTRTHADTHPPPHAHACIDRLRTHLPGGPGGAACVVTSAGALQGLDGPHAFRARTRRRYERPGCRPVRMAWVSEGPVVTTCSQGPAARVRTRMCVSMCVCTLFCTHVSVRSDGVHAYASVCSFVSVFVRVCGHTLRHA